MDERELHKQTICDLVQAIWNERDLSQLSTYHQQDFVNHTVPFGMDSGMHGLTTSMKLFFNAFSDIRLDIHDQIAENDKVASFVTFHGRHTGSFMNVAPSHRTVQMTGIRIDRVRDGKVAEHWASFDLAGLMQQLM